MPLIETINLGKTYTLGKSLKAVGLRHINLQVEPQDFLAIAGPSGSGKSSLLNLLGTLDMATEGSILYEGHNIAKKNAEELSHFRLHNIGFIFQAYNLINSLTALENVEFIMLLQRRSAFDRRLKAIDMLRRVGLIDYINRFPSEMSGGQQQRVAIARAIVAEPKVILADEPTANLDSKTAQSLLDLMEELNREKRITFIFSTHDKMVMDKAKRLIHLKDGEIVQ